MVAAVQGLHLGSANGFLSYHRLTRFLSKVIRCDPVSDPLPRGQGACPALGTRGRQGPGKQGPGGGWMDRQLSASGTGPGCGPGRVPGGTPRPFPGLGAGRGFFEEKRLGNLSVGRRVVPGGPWSLNPSRVGEPSKKRGHKAGGVNGPCPNAVWGGDRSSFVRATMWMPDKWTLYKGSCEVSLHGKPAPDNLFLWPLLRGCFCECRSPLSLSP